MLTYLGEEAPVYLLPEPEVLPFERLAVDGRTVNQRLTALSVLAAAAVNSDTPSDKQRPPLVVASVAAALRLTLPASVLAGGDGDTGAFTRLRVGQRIARTEELLAAWVRLGYRHEPLVESPGSFSQRGGIIDIFPPHCEYPWRLELWGDEVDTLRPFDPYTQRSMPVETEGDAAEVVVIPAREQLPGPWRSKGKWRGALRPLTLLTVRRPPGERIEEELVELFANPNIETLSFYNGLLNSNSLLDCLPADAVLVLDRESQIETEALDLEEKFFRMRESREGRGELPGNFPSPYLSWRELSVGLGRHKERVLLESWVGDGVDNLFQTAPAYLGQLEQFSDDLKIPAAAGASGGCGQSAHPPFGGSFSRSRRWRGPGGSSEKSAAAGDGFT